jgi:hypothetical protein
LNIIGHQYDQTGAALSTDFYRQKRRGALGFAMARTPQSPVAETVFGPGPPPRHDPSAGEGPAVEL